jgi:hypothetical protein
MFPQASARTRSVYGTTCWRRESCAYLQRIPPGQLLRQHRNNLRIGKPLNELHHPGERRFGPAACCSFLPRATRIEKAESSFKTPPDKDLDVHDDSRAEMDGTGRTTAELPTPKKDSLHATRQCSCEC